MVNMCLCVSLREVYLCVSGFIYIDYVDFYQEKMCAS